MILIVFGSSSDSLIYNKIAAELKKYNLPYELRVLSAHRTPDELDNLLKTKSYSVIIAGAGLAAHLPGVIASRTTTPVIGVPCTSNFDGIDSLLSIMQMPPGIPVLSVGIDNAAEAAHAAALITKKHVSVSLHGSGKAYETCKKTLQDFNIPITSDGLPIRFLALTETPSTEIAINVPIAESSQSSHIPLLKNLTKHGLWVGLNRGENAALAAVAILGHHDKLKTYRNQLKQKVLEADRMIHAV